MYSVTESPESKKPTLSKSRGGEKVNVLKVCEELVQEVAQKDEAWPFLKPVLKRDVCACIYTVIFAVINSKILVY